LIEDKESPSRSGFLETDGRFCGSIGNPEVCDLNFMLAVQERPMHTHRFGRKIKLPATIAIKHQIRKLMFDDLVKKAEAEARAEVFRGQPSEELLVDADTVSGPNRQA
jgi:hypothetical protein